jgi:hypothetical protein
MGINTKNILKQVEDDIWSKIDNIPYDILIKLDDHIFSKVEDALRDCYKKR